MMMPLPDATPASASPPNPIAARDCLTITRLRSSTARALNQCPGPVGSDRSTLRQIRGSKVGHSKSKSAHREDRLSASDRRPRHPLDLDGELQGWRQRNRAGALAIYVSTVFSGSPTAQPDT